MKKSILILGIVLTTFSLMAIGVINWKSNSAVTKKKSKIEFFYDVDSRFVTTVTKDQLHNAKSIFDIIPSEGTQLLQDFKDVSIALLGENEYIQTGNGAMLTPAQTELLKKADYSTDIHITSNCLSKRNMLGALRDYDLVYYITVIPEKEAEYKNGHVALMEYIQSNSIESSMELNEGKLRPGKIKFVIDEAGKVEDVSLNETCGYTAIDENLIALIKNLPVMWTPAKNSKGASVSQEYVLSFGKVGC